MHELSIANEIIRIVEKEMSGRRLTEIKSVAIRLGALSGVDPDALSFGFEAGTADTLLSGAGLVIERIPVKGTCRSCKRDFQMDEFVFLCPCCGSADMDIIQGEELELDHLVVE